MQKKQFGFSDHCHRALDGRRPVKGGAEVSQKEVLPLLLH
jgi:hypothetical protein